MTGENRQQTKIPTRPASADFVGRSEETEKLLSYARGESASAGLLLLHAPAAGASKLLRQTFDRFFSEQNETLPVYFQFHPADKTVRAAARRFLQELLLGTIAFRRRDKKLAGAFPNPKEISGLLAPEERLLFEPLLEWLKDETADERLFAENCFAAPLRLATEAANLFVIFDDLHNAETLSGETDLIAEIKKIYARSGAKFVLAGRRRFLLDAVRQGSESLANPEILRLEKLSDPDTKSLIARLGEKISVRISEQSVDLIARQFDSNPLFITALFEAAGERKCNLDSFQNVEQIYLDELLGGRLGRFFDTEFERATGNFQSTAQVIRLLQKSADEENQNAKIEKWRKHFSIPDSEFFRLIRRLHYAEIVNAGSNVIRAESENLSLADYLETRHRLEISGHQRALVVGEQLAKVLKRAPQLMARVYRRSSAIGLRELLAGFNCQSIPESLIDYARFKEDFKGLTADEILASAGAESEKVNLPQIVFSAHCAAFYPPIDQFAEAERAAVGVGFESADYRPENEIVWIATEIDSKLEAARELAEFWCDRLEMVALACNFTKYRLWLIAPEGFSPEAMEVLSDRQALGSSRSQVKLLVKLLGAGNLLSENHRPNEYELVIPMGDDTEMIAAGAVEEIARRHSFQPKAITQIKTALVEACINATEHSHSPDRKIYQRFSVEDDKIIITISNRGIKIPSEKVAEMTMQIDPDEGRRGWGLKLMRRLMDDVRFEQVDDGTRISMVKYLR